MARDEPVEIDNVSVLILNASKVEETEALLKEERPVTLRVPPKVVFPLMDA